MRESAIDRRFTNGVKKLGGTTIKLSALGFRGAAGWPDRLVLLPGGFVAFVELKVPGKEPTDLQRERLKQLKQLGMRAEWFDDADRALQWLTSCRWGNA